MHFLMVRSNPFIIREPGNENSFYIKKWNEKISMPYVKSETILNRIENLGVLVLRLYQKAWLIV